MTFRKSMIVLSGAALLLAGCESQQITPVATEPDPVSVKLAQAADKAANALNNISNIEQYKNPAVPPIRDDYASAPPNMVQPVSIRWSGPIEQITRVLAERAGLRFRVKGRLPGAPVIVNVDAYQQPILHVLRDVGFQAGTRADLSIDTNEGVVEVRYAAADASR